MGMSATSVVMISVAFLCFAFVMPIALNTLFGNGTSPGMGYVNSSVNPTVKTIATVVASLIAALGILLKFIPRGK